MNFKKLLRGAKPEHPLVCLLRLSKPRAFSAISADIAMARTQGAKSSSPSTRLKIFRCVPVQDSISEPPRPRLAPPPVKSAPTSPLAKRYNTRRSLTIAGASSSRGQKSGTGPPMKKAKVLEPIDLTESSSELESESSPFPPPAKKSPPLAKKPQPSQAPVRESQIPSDMTPEEAIRHPMVTQPPIARNLDCKARPFHSELCFDIAAFRIQPKLRESFRLLQRYRMEHLLTPRDFFYPRVALDFYQSMTTNQVRDPTVIHFTIDGQHGILGARHIAEPVHIPYEPARPEDFRAWTRLSQSDMVHTLSRVASSRHYILRKELPPACSSLMHSCAIIFFHFSIGCRGEE